MHIVKKNMIFRQKNNTPLYILCALLAVIIFFIMKAQFFPNHPLPVALTSRLKVVTSFYPLYFFASEVGGDGVDVYNLTPAGAEPHEYEPTTEDLARIENSQLLILNGGALEPWGDKIQTNLKEKNTVVVTVGEDIATKMVIEEGKATHDPHVWLDPLLAAAEVDRVVRAFVQVDPLNRVVYEANGEMLKQKLKNLDAAYVAGLGVCAKKEFVTAHAAFAYLAARYQLTQVAIAGLSPDEEPSARTLIEIAEFAKKNNISYIFFENLVSPKLAETLANEIGAKTLVLNPIEGLTSADAAAGKNYFTEMMTNLVHLRIALQCQ